MTETYWNSPRSLCWGDVHDVENAFDNLAVSCGKEEDFSHSPSLSPDERDLGNVLSMAVTSDHTSEMALTSSSSVSR